MIVWCLPVLVGMSLIGSTAAGSGKSSSKSQPSPPPQSSPAPAPSSPCTVKQCSDLREGCTGSGCFEYGNYHYDYTHICASAQVGKNGQCVTGSNSVTYSEAEEICTNKGARLCSMTELRYNVAAGTGCDVEDNLIWTLTSCDNGHVAQGGTLVGSRKGGLEAGCKKDSQTAGVVCCSSDRDADKCVSEAAKECSSNDGSHSCCDDRKYTYNPVPCTADMDCQACVEPTPDMNGHGQCVDRVYYKKMEISGSKQGFMCCNSEPNQVKCESGYCSLAPCSGGKEQDSSGDWTLTFMSPAWTNVRGDEWSRAHCKACHGNGCDQCDDGYFKYSQKAECLLCDAIDGCTQCHLQGCAQCKSNLPRTRCDALPGLSEPSYCCETGRRTMCSTTSPSPPTTRTLSPSTPAPVPMTSPPTPPTPSTCNPVLSQWSGCKDAPTCCASGLRCFQKDQWYAQCLYTCPSSNDWTCIDLSGATPAPNTPPTPPTCNTVVNEWGDCTRAPTCCASGLRCFEKDQWYAQCRYSCPASNDWTCNDLSGITKAPTDAPATKAPRTHAPRTKAPPTSAPPTNAPPTSAPPTNVPSTSAPPTSAPPTNTPVECPADFPNYDCLHCWNVVPTAVECSTCPTEARPYIGCDECWETAEEAAECRCFPYGGKPIDRCGKCFASEWEAVNCEGSHVPAMPTPLPATFAPMICPPPFHYQCGYCWVSAEEADFMCPFYCNADEPFAQCGSCFASQQEADACTCEGTQIKACDSCFPTQAKADVCTAPFLPTIDGTNSPPGTVPATDAPATYSPGICFDPPFEGCGSCWKSAAAAAGCEATVCPPGEFFGCGQCFTVEFFAMICSCPASKPVAGCQQCWSTQTEADACQGPFPSL